MAGDSVMKKGDVLTIVLIMANISLICLFTMRGSIISTGTFSGDNSADLISTPMSVATVNVTLEPFPAITRAVADEQPLFAVISSSPRSQPDISHATPTPEPVPDSKYTPNKSKPTPSYKVKAWKAKDIQSFKPLMSASPGHKSWKLRDSGFS